jgi:hypothetical protein
VGSHPGRPLGHALHLRGWCTLSLLLLLLLLSQPQQLLLVLVSH